MVCNELKYNFLQYNNYSVANIQPKFLRHNYFLTQGFSLILFEYTKTKLRDKSLKKYRLYFSKKSIFMFRVCNCFIENAVIDSIFVCTSSNFFFMKKYTIPVFCAFLCLFFLTACPQQKEDKKEELPIPELPQEKIYRTRTLIIEADCNEAIWANLWLEKLIDDKTSTGHGSILRPVKLSDEVKKLGFTPYSGDILEIEYVVLNQPVKNFPCPEWIVRDNPLFTDIEIRRLRLEKNVYTQCSDTCLTTVVARKLNCPTMHSEFAFENEVRVLRGNDTIREKVLLYPIVRKGFTPPYQLKDGDTVKIKYEEVVMNCFEEETHCPREVRIERIWLNCLTK
jgi:hypothetical protein